MLPRGQWLVYGLHLGATAPGCVGPRPLMHCLCPPQGVLRLGTKDHPWSPLAEDTTQITLTLPPPRPTQATGKAHGKCRQRLNNERDAPDIGQEREARALGGILHWEHLRVAAFLGIFSL